MPDRAASRAAYRAEAAPIRHARALISLSFCTGQKKGPAPPAPRHAAPRAHAHAGGHGGEPARFTCAVVHPRASWRAYAPRSAGSLAHLLPRARVFGFSPRRRPPLCPPPPLLQSPRVRGTSEATEPRTTAAPLGVPPHFPAAPPLLPLASLASGQLQIAQLENYE